MMESNFHEDEEKLHHSETAGGNVKWYSHSGKHFDRFFFLLVN